MCFAMLLTQRPLILGQKLKLKNSFLQFKINISDWFVIECNLVNHTKLLLMLAVLTQLVNSLEIHNPKTKYISIKTKIILLSQQAKE